VWSKLNNMYKECSGSTLPLAAVLLAIIAGFAALAIDVGAMYTKQAQLQTTADAAVLAAVIDLPDETAARAAALEYSEKNMPASQDGTVLMGGDVEFGQWDAQSKVFTAGVSPANDVRVTTRKAQSNGNAQQWYVAKIFGFGASDISAVAVAGRSSVPCLLTLDPSAGGAISLDLNAQINASSCVVHSNSSSSSAANAQSNSLINSQKTCLVGGYSGGGSNYSPAPETGCPAIADPLENISPPIAGACDYNNVELDNANTTLNPGVYCGGIEIDGNSNVTFNPGIYIIRDGQFEVNSNSSVSGDGVGFYLTGSASTLYFDSNSSLDFIAPSTGEMAGIIFFEDRNAPLLRSHRFDSNSIARLEGAIYLSRGRLVIDSNGTIGGSSAFTTIVARRVSLDSNVNLVMNTDYASSSVPNFGAGTSSVNLLQ